MDDATALVLRRDESQSLTVTTTSGTLFYYRCWTGMKQWKVQGAVAFVHVHVLALVLLERFCSAPKFIFKSILSLIFYCCFYYLLMQDFYALPIMAENRFQIRFQP